MNDEKPPISVAVLTCNRRETLRESLQSLERQTLYPRCEIIVVDNASGDGTAEMVAEEFPRLRYFRLADNVGCAGRNVGIEAARADIVATLDDDVFLRGEDELERIIAFFAEHPDVHGVSFKILDEETGTLLFLNWHHPRKHEAYRDATFETDNISEGAAAFRKVIFSDTGYYAGDLFISHEGMDLAYRILDSGYRLSYSGDIAVVHRYARAQRTPWRNAYFNTRNFIWLNVRHLPFGRMVGEISYRLLTAFAFCLRRGQVRWYAKAVFDGFKGVGPQWAKRKPIGRETLRRLREIRRLRPGVLYKTRNFLQRMSLMSRKLDAGKGT